MATQSRQGSACIVVVEDDAPSCHALTRLLASAGYTVIAAATVREAREAVARHGCDLLIADLGLPDGSGVELLRELRETHGLSRGIALTGYTATADVAACEAAGFAAFLSKPVHFPVLEQTVRRVLGHASQRPAVPP